MAPTSLAGDSVDERLSPLDMMLALMHHKWNAGEHDAAVDLARAAAPYIHPRLPPAAPVLRADPRVMTDDELRAELDQLRSR